ncbi:TlpA family protein disulfide reductase [Paenibacillus rigui]|uniref:Thioredoxin n=1 Tax=Paenibacillus rigui TaxID=554312 RepID=A0A229UL35_9BACL|nr:TlpA disulfide reductase family protein [Paenibacillus rigui]OXM84116.1 thioredoxin [Paenibacillus rigui]
MKRNMPVMLIALLLVGLAMYQSGTIKETSQASAAAAGMGSAVEMARNKPVPGFTLESLDGHTYQVGGQREKPLMINFWATWCGPCHEEAPDLKQVYEKYKDKFDVYAVNVTKGDRVADVKGFVKQYQLPFPVLLDKEGKAAEMYRILFVPTSFLIDKQGVLRDVIHVLPREQLEKRIQMLVEG